MKNHPDLHFFCLLDSLKLEISLKLSQEMMGFYYLYAN